MFTKSIKLAQTFLAVTLLVLSLFSVPAFALSLDDAKAQGLVGELPNGYLGVVTASPAAQALVNEINAKRKSHYQGIAQRNGTPLPQVEQMAGQKAIERTATGNFIMVNQQWKKK